MEQNSSDAQLIVSKIDDLREFQIQHKKDFENKIDDLQRFYEREVDHLKEFYTESKLDMKEDIGEIKQSNKEVSEKLDDFVSNHYSYHQREKKKFFRWTIISGAIVLVLIFSGAGEVLLPYIIGLARLLWIF